MQNQKKALQDPIECARAIRPYLETLLPLTEAEILDARLAELLNADPALHPVEVQNAITELLLENEGTAEWMKIFSRYNAPPEVLAMLGTAGYSKLPGDSGDIAGIETYRCPKGDFVFHKSKSGQFIPRCKTHGVPLLLAKHGAS